jgi:hypothetical protein
LFPSDVSADKPVLSPRSSIGTINGITEKARTRRNLFDYPRMESAYNDNHGRLRGRRQHLRRKKVIRSYLDALYPDSVPLEMRLMTKSDFLGTVSGVYDNYEVLAEQALELNAKGYNVYITLNGTNPAVTNSWFPKARHTTKDRDVPSYRYLLVDRDPLRAPNTSSTDEEKAEAWKTATALREYLADQGWTEPFVADSGNGFHLLYRVSFSANSENIVMMRRCLASLDAKFSNKACKLDTTTYNPARITKLYRTVICKGANTTDRPHRHSAGQLPNQYQRVSPSNRSFRICTRLPKKLTRPSRRWGRRPEHLQRYSRSGSSKTTHDHRPQYRSRKIGTVGHSQLVCSVARGPMLTDCCL